MFGRQSMQTVEKSLRFFSITYLALKKLLLSIKVRLSEKNALFERFFLRA
jgi:hypothetical protein